MTDPKILAPHSTRAITIDAQAIPAPSALASLIEEWKALANTAFDPVAWSLAGHALMIEHEDSDEVMDWMPRIAAASGMAWHIIAREDVIAQQEQWLPTTLTNTPSLFFLEAGFWVVNHCLHEDNKEDFIGEVEVTPESAQAFRARLAGHLRDKLVHTPVVLITAVKKVGRLDIALRRHGLFDRRIRMPMLSLEQRGAAFLTHLGTHLCDPSLQGNLARIGALAQMEFPSLRMRHLALMALQRTAARRRGVLQFADLVQVAVYGTLEQDGRIPNPVQLRSTAIHEAGHALVRMLAVDTVDFPDYCSVIARGDTLGIVVASYESQLRADDDPTYAAMLHTIRVNLAGRAAEHVLLGPEHISARGASEDLKAATATAYAMLGRYGLPISLLTDNDVGANLAVVIDELATVQQERTATMIRTMLSEQYAFVVALLWQHETLLEGLVEQLMLHHVLVREDLEEIHRRRHVAGAEKAMSRNFSDSLSQC